MITIAIGTSIITAMKETRTRAKGIATARKILTTHITEGTKTRIITISSTRIITTMVTTKPLQR